MYDILCKLVQHLKKQRPLILNITNLVTMDFIANGLLSLGASPIMTQAVNELRDLIKIANGIVINIGTLNDEFVTLCEQACKIANELNKPIILDPVGAGASHYRTQTCLYLINQYQFSSIRGNASEVMALCNSSQTTKGVDTNIATYDAIKAAQYFSEKHNLIVVISGKTDAVIHETNSELLDRGSALMPLVTGSGCLLTAVISAFQTVHSNHYEAAIAAINFYGVCGEIAARKTNNPGSFKPHFLDALAEFPVRGDYEI